MSILLLSVIVLARDKSLKTKTDFPAPQWISTDKHYIYSAGDEAQYNNIIKSSDKDTQRSDPHKTDCQWLTIKKGIKLGMCCFWGWSNINRIDLEEGVTVDPEAWKCFSQVAITKLVVPSSITMIPVSFVNSCPNLVSVYVQGNITQIGNFALKGCAKLTGLYYFGYTTVTEKKTDGSTNQNALVSSVTTVYVAKDFTGNFLKDLTPKKMTIKSGSFTYSYFLDRIDIEQDGSNTKNVDQASMINGVKGVNAGLEGYATYFKRFNFIKGKINFPNYAFGGDKNTPAKNKFGLEVLVLEGPSEIAFNTRSFSNSTALREIRISDACTNVGSTAFADNQELQYVKIGGPVTGKGWDFNGCPKLTKFVYCGSTLTYKTDNDKTGFFTNSNNCHVYITSSFATPGDVGGLKDSSRIHIISNAYSKDGLDLAYAEKGMTVTGAGNITKELIVGSIDNTCSKCIDKSTIETVDVNGDATIAANSFDFFNHLTSVNIKSSSINIGSSAFRGCIVLSLFHINSELTFSGNNIVTGCAALHEIYYCSLVPAVTGSVSNPLFGLDGLSIKVNAAYKPDAMGEISIKAGDKILDKSCKIQVPTIQFSISHPFEATTQFTHSHVFDATDKMSLSDIFTGSNQFSKSNTFEKKVMSWAELESGQVISSEVIKSKSNKFSQSFDFIGSTHFTVSKEFLKTEHFKSTKDFSMTGIFDYTNYFSISRIFDHTNEFSLSRNFVESNYFSISQEFSKTKEFIETTAFSISKSFKSTSDFKESTKFSISNNFNVTDIFSKSQIFMQSRTYSGSDGFKHSEMFSLSKLFDNTKIFSDSSVFVETLRFSFSSEPPLVPESSLIENENIFSSVKVPDEDREQSSEKQEIEELSSDRTIGNENEFTTEIQHYQSSEKNGEEENLESSQPQNEGENEHSSEKETKNNHQQSSDINNDENKFSSNQVVDDENPQSSEKDNEQVTFNKIKEDEENTSEENKVIFSNEDKRVTSKENDDGWLSSSSEQHEEDQGNQTSIEQNKEEIISSELKNNKENKQSSGNGGEDDNHESEQLNKQTSQILINLKSTTLKNEEEQSTNNKYEEEQSPTNKNEEEQSPTHRKEQEQSATLKNEQEQTTEKKKEEPSSIKVEHASEEMKQTKTGTNALQSFVKATTNLNNEAETNEFAVDSSQISSPIEIINKPSQENNEEKSNDSKLSGGQVAGIVIGVIIVVAIIIAVVVFFLLFKEGKSYSEGSFDEYQGDATNELETEIFDSVVRTIQTDDNFDLGEEPNYADLDNENMETYEYEYEEGIYFPYFEQQANNFIQ